MSLLFKKIFKFSIFLGIFLFIIYGANFALQWRNLTVNAQTDKNMHSCIYNDNYTNIILSSLSTKFEASFIENAEKDCINPSFPIIHIKTTEKHNAWLHIVRTDCMDENLQKFIDGDVELDYPFYTLDRDFYDAPLWRYAVFSKPLSY